MDSRPTIDQLREYRRLMQQHRNGLPASAPTAKHAGGALADVVKEDIADFIRSQNTLMFNERDFQVQLALHLASQRHYDDIEIEYFVPNSLAEGYDWDSNLYIDIVVCKGDEYVPVELKYTTREVRKDISRFGQTLPDVPIIRNQGADNNIRYNFWKDVRRLELIGKIFPKVHNGLAVMLTCDPAFLKEHRPTVASYPFSMNEGFTAGGGVMDWTGEVKARDNHRPFLLENEYTVHWQTVEIENVEFNFTIIKI